MPFTNDTIYDDVPRIEEAIAAHPLGAAIASRDVVAVTRQLARGADANAVVVGTDGSWSQQELPMLHIAAQVDEANIARALLAAGARVDARSRYDNFHWPDGFDGAEDVNDALEEAAACGSVDVLELLLQRRATANTARALVLAVRAGRLRAAKLILDHGGDPGTTTSEPLCAAIESDHLGDKLDVAKLLVEYGAHLEQAHGGHRSPLHAAVALGKTAIVRFLVDAGARRPTRRWLRQLPEAQRARADAALADAVNPFKRARPLLS